MLNPQIIDVYLDQLLLFILDVNFRHKNDIFWIWVQLIKRSLESVVSTLIKFFEKFVNFKLL